MGKGQEEAEGVKHQGEDGLCKEGRFKPFIVEDVGNRGASSHVCSIFPPEEGVGVNVAANGIGTEG